MSERLITEGLIARMVSYGDYDLILTLLTTTQGKISVVARRAKRSRRRYGGGLDLFIIGRAHLKSQYQSGMFYLEQFEGKDDLGSLIRGDIIKVAQGSYILEIARELWPEGQPEPLGFRIVEKTLRLLAKSQSTPMLLRAFELKILEALGLAPLLNRCACCAARTIFPYAQYDPAQGGMICRRCALGSDRLIVTPRAQQMLLFLQHSSLDQAININADREIICETRRLMASTIRFHLGKEPRALLFIQQLNKRSNRVERKHK